MTFALVSLGISAQQNTPEEGVVINGVRWATRNVDRAGTFAKTPESTGRLYQWNRKTAWYAINPIQDWDGTTPTGIEWEKANDPCPAGWRVPDADDIQALVDEEKVSNELIVQKNKNDEKQPGVLGRRFMDIDTGASIFLPAAGVRAEIYGTLNAPSATGYYWSRTPLNNVFAYGLNFNKNSAQKISSERGYGQTVRCVGE